MIDTNGSTTVRIPADKETTDPLEDHRRYLYRYARLHLRDSALVEDAVQETFLAALASRSGFAGRSQLRTWLTSILRNKIIGNQAGAAAAARMRIECRLQQRGI